MKLSPNFLAPLILALGAATIAASNATFGGVKPDLTVRDLLPGNAPVTAETTNR